MQSSSWVENINHLSTVVGGAKALVSLDPEGLIEAARKTTGLSCFGEAGWQEKLGSRLQEVEASIDLHALGRLLWRIRMIQILQNRLIISALEKSSPEIFRARVLRPMFITGNPRSGTTILFEALSQGDNFRSILGWEVEYPAGFPKNIAASGITQQEFGRAYNDLLVQIQPDIKALHEVRWDLPAECARIMEISLESVHLMDKEAKYTNTKYIWHKKILQILQATSLNKQWLLKCPSHLSSIRLLLETYPDAAIIHIHRDPVRSVASLLGLLGYWSRTMGDYNKKFYSEFLIKNIEEALRNSIDVRESGSVALGQIYDIRYVDFMRNPILEVEKIYGNFGLIFNGRDKKRIMEYIKNKPQYFHGRYSFDLKDYGFTEQAIRKRFMFYTDYFQVPAES